MNKDNFVNRKPEIIGEGQFRKYAVFAPLLKQENEYCLLFEKRSKKLNRQPGEICFPGGKMEKGESMQECAIRETMEELCIDAHQIEVYGKGDIFISPFNLIIYPYIGELKDYKYTFSADEVDEILTVPFAFFRNNQPERYKNNLIHKPAEEFPYDRIPGGEKYPWAKGTYDILFYQYNQHIIWGLTARIVQSVIQLINEYHLIEE